MCHAELGVRLKKEKGIQRTPPWWWWQPPTPPFYVKFRITCENRRRSSIQEPSESEIKVHSSKEREEEKETIHFSKEGKAWGRRLSQKQWAAAAMTHGKERERSKMMTSDRWRHQSYVILSGWRNRSVAPDFSFFGKFSFSFLIFSFSELLLGVGDKERGIPGEPGMETLRGRLKEYCEHFLPIEQATRGVRKSGSGRNQEEEEE